MGYQRQQFDKRKNQYMTDIEHCRCCGFHGGYYYDRYKKRYIKVFSQNLKRYVKNLDNKRFRRIFKTKLHQNLDDEGLITNKEKLFDINAWW